MQALPPHLKCIHAYTALAPVHAAALPVVVAAGCVWTSVARQVAVIRHDSSPANSMKSMYRCIAGMAAETAKQSRSGFLQRKPPTALQLQHTILVKIVQLGKQSSKQV